MVCSTLNNTKIIGITSVCPVNKVHVTYNKNLYNGDERKINRLINSSGFEYRRIVSDKTTTSDLCLYAANFLLNKVNIQKEEIDGLIFVSYTPDYIMPATSYVLHSKLDLSENCIVMDIPQACSGYITGLYQASMLINSGCKKVLLLVGDTFSKFNDMFNETEPEIFGDAGTATLIEYDENAKPVYFNINSSGKYYDALICSNGGFRNQPKSTDFYNNSLYKYNSKMDGKAIFDFTMTKISPSIKDLLMYSKKEITDIDYVILHQANKFIMQNILRQINCPEEKSFLTTLGEYGNQCGASIPCTICNSLASDITNKNLNLLLCGFGAGLSWGSAVLNTENIYCSKIIDFE